MAFDEAGNRKAPAFLKEIQQQDNRRVEVTGEVHGNTMTVERIRLL